MPSIELTRTIHPVGQGAFYSEVFTLGDEIKFTVVYDCGGKRGPLQNEIDKLCECSVDILFISHFHYDHISGVPALMERCQPKMVIFPGVSPATFAIDVIYNSLKNPRGDSLDTMMTLFLPTLAERNQDNKYIPIRHGEKKSYPAKEIAWEYDVMFFETAEPERKFLKKVLNALNLPEDDFNKYHEEEYYRQLAKRVRSNDIVNIVKGIMEKGFEGNHNSYSLQVYSHQPGEEQSLCFDCLYMGDIKVPDFYKKYIKVSNPYYLQVPHHGSCYNYDQVFLDARRVVFVSVGNKNSFHHPGLTELNSFVHFCKDVRLVTEDSSTEYKISGII